jgi:hypothetical protein
VSSGAQRGFDPVEEWQRANIAEGNIAHGRHRKQRSEDLIPCSNEDYDFVTVL